MTKASEDILPFKIDVPQETLDSLQTRLALTRFPAPLDLPTGQEWSYGTPDAVSLP